MDSQESLSSSSPRSALPPCFIQASLLSLLFPGIFFSQFTSCGAFPALLDPTIQSPLRTWREAFSGGGRRGPICAFQGVQEMSPHISVAHTRAQRVQFGSSMSLALLYAVHHQIQTISVSKPVLLSLCYNHPHPSPHLEPQTQASLSVSLLNPVFSSSVLTQ